MRNETMTKRTVTACVYLLRIYSMYSIIYERGVDVSGRSAKQRAELSTHSRESERIRRLPQARVDNSFSTFLGAHLSGGVLLKSIGLFSTLSRRPLWLDSAAAAAPPAPPTTL